MTPESSDQQAQDGAIVAPQQMDGSLERPLRSSAVVSLVGAVMLVKGLSGAMALVKIPSGVGVGLAVLSVAHLPAAVALLKRQRWGLHSSIGLLLTDTVLYLFLASGEIGTAAMLSVGTAVLFATSIALLVWKKTRGYFEG